MEDAPCLERLLCADDAGTRSLDVSVNVAAARKLETIGCARDWSGQLQARVRFNGFSGMACRQLDDRGAQCQDFICSFVGF
ncbi:unnamed protein product [Urochloa humidicola]